ncbi:MAG TPA: cation diffusion facilitator family transporter [Anaerolineaceae bacterium]|nr:cation diffusion facilitator family transporter [Anaerolineaceae bacterium]
MEKTVPSEIESAANREKKWAALSSLFAIIFITAMKFIVALLTGSLGLLAEAAHSLLDLVAAVVTYIAVKVSSQPADRVHTYGHGKVENLSALFESLLLLITCAGIFYEAINRLFFKQVVVESSIWSFLVMGASIIINITRSRQLKKTAKKYNSQALEAQALDFTADILSSSVVLVGLILVFVSEQYHIPWLAKADSIAGMVVAGLVSYVSLKLGRRAIGELMDEVPENLQDEIARAARLPGVEEVRQVRVRRSGSDYFVDLVLAVSRSLTASQAHEITEKVEKAVQDILPNSHVMVHVDPIRTADEDLVETIHVLASQYGLSAHNIRVDEDEGGITLLVHLDVDDNLRVEEAHARATAFEEAVQQAYPWLDKVVTHIEPEFRSSEIADESTAQQEEQLKAIINQLPETTGIECDVHEIHIYQQVGQKTDVSFHCSVHGEITVARAHEITEIMENSLRDQFPNLGQVLIHIEPLN